MNATIAAKIIRDLSDYAKHHAQNGAPALATDSDCVEIAMEYRISAQAVINLAAAAGINILVG